MKTIRETEKAVQIEAIVQMDIAPQGQLASSLIKDKEGKWTFWCPKSVIKDGKIADWFLDREIEKAKKYYEGKNINSQIVSINMYFPV